MASRFSNNYESIYAAFRPVNNTAAKMAAKDRELQLLGYVEEQERQKTARTAQQIQLQQQWQSEIDALEFESPDKQRLKSLFIQKEKDIKDRIKKQYGGDWRKFLDAEAATSAQRAQREVLSSDVFITAKSNKENVALAKKAILDGKNLIGGIDPKSGLYRYAEQDLEAFQSGASLTFEYKGAYDPKEGAKVQEYFSKMSNPFGKFNNEIGVPEVEKLLGAKRMIGDAGGEDYYYRSLANKPMYYKRESPEELQKFNMDLAKSAASIASSKASVANTYSSMQSRSFRDSLALQKFELEKADSVSGGSRFIDDVANIPNNVTKTYHFTPNSSDVSKNLTTFGRGVTLNDIASSDVSGNPQLNFFELAAPVSGDLISKAAGTYGKSAKVKEVILPTKGGAVLNLEGIPHEIIENSSSKFYMDQNTYGGSRDKGFQEATIRIKKGDLGKTGLVDKGLIWNSKTRLGLDDTNVKDYGKYMDVKVLVPFRYTPVLDRELNKSVKGQKTANEASYSESGFDRF